MYDEDDQLSEDEIAELNMEKLELLAESEDDQLSEVEEVELNMLG